MEFRVCFTFGKYGNIGCRYVRQPNVFIDAFFYFKIHLHQLGQFKLIKTLLKSLHVL